MPTITDVFDACSKDDVLAFMEMQYKGVWPDWFKQKHDWKNITFPEGWKRDLEGRMVLVYAEHLLGYETILNLRLEARKGLQ